jgi:TM2 domain-containing membrane protein YozV
MKRPIKAALLSGLVFPGVGHLYLKRYVRGILLAAAAAVLSYFIISVAINTAFDIAGKIQSGDVPLNAASISNLVSRDTQGSENSSDIATIALFALWLIGIIDSYRAGRAREKPKEIDTKNSRISE